MSFIKNFVLFLCKIIVSSFVLQCLFSTGRLLYMRLHRFYVEQSLGEVIVIQRKELLGQWIKVLRYKKGSRVILFNGNGFDTTYTVGTISPKEITLFAESTVSSYIPQKKVHLCVSIIKKDTFELITQKATELGVSVIIPILSDRSEKKNINIKRLATIVRESSEQCGRGDIPFVLGVHSLQEALNYAQNAERSFVCDTFGTTLPLQEALVSASSVSSIALFIGPEGGWTDSEREQFTTYHTQPVSLGKTILRAETAAIVACAYTSS